MKFAVLFFGNVEQLLQNPKIIEGREELKDTLEAAHAAAIAETAGASKLVLAVVSINDAFSGGRLEAVAHQGVLYKRSD